MDAHGFTARIATRRPGRGRGKEEGGITTELEELSELERSQFLQWPWRSNHRKGRERTRADTAFCHLQIKPVQKQTRAGQRTRFKAVVIIGDSEGHVGLGIKTSKEVATAIRAAIIIAKLSVIPVRRGYWGTNLGQPHSLPCKQSGKCGSVTVRVRLILPVSAR